MAIEKLIITQEIKPFTTHLNSVLQGVKDATALGIWCYLSSLAPNWVVNKEQLKKHFKIGRDKLNKLLTKLQNFNLIDIQPIKSADGRFESWHIVVKNGSEFQNTENQCPGKLQNTENPVTGKPLQWKTTTKKEIGYKKNKKLERGISLSDFKKEEALKICKEKNLDFDKELTKFKNHFEGKQISYGKFLNWLTRAKPERQEVPEDSLQDYIYRFMKDTKCSEEEARNYYKQRGYQ